MPLLAVIIIVAYGCGCIWLGYELHRAPVLDEDRDPRRDRW